MGRATARKPPGHPASPLCPQLRVAAFPGGCLLGTRHEVGRPPGRESAAPCTRSVGLAASRD
eukprot:2608817-Alexandrium_andersonii.AAC.1